jgi:hypothetical protein
MFEAKSHILHRNNIDHHKNLNTCHVIVTTWTFKRVTFRFYLRVIDILLNYLLVDLLWIDNGDLAVSKMCKRSQLMWFWLLFAVYNT